MDSLELMDLLPVELEKRKRWARRVQDIRGRSKEDCAYSSPILERVGILSFERGREVGHPLCILRGSRFATLGKRFDNAFPDNTRDSALSQPSVLVLGT